MVACGADLNCISSVKNGSSTCLYCKHPKETVCCVMETSNCWPVLGDKKQYYIIYNNGI